MNQLVSFAAHASPALVAAAGERACVRFLEFFTANIRNPHTRRAYARGVGEFLTWCERGGVASIIRLSDKSSRLHPRHVVPKPA
jgi:hypothetical protein